MSRFAGALGVFAVLVLSVGFAALNGGQRVTLRLGFATLYGVPLTVVALGGLVTGMVIMLGANIHSDLKVRRILRARLMEEDLEERARFIDRSQQDLFDGDEQASGSQRRRGDRWSAEGGRRMGETGSAPGTEHRESSGVEEQSD